MPDVNVDILQLLSNLPFTIILLYLLIREQERSRYMLEQLQKEHEKFLAVVGSGKLSEAIQSVLTGS